MELVAPGPLVGGVAGPQYGHRYTALRARGEHGGEPYVFYRWRPEVVVPLMREALDRGSIVGGDPGASKLRRDELFRRHGYRWAIVAPDGRVLSISAAELEVGQLDRKHIPS